MPIGRTHAISLITCAAAILLGGCERSADRQNAAAGSTAKSQAAARVRLGYFANLTHAQAVLGVSSGDFASAVAPAKFETRIFNAGPSLIEALLAGELDIGYVGPGPALHGHATTRGQGVRIIAGVAANGVVIVARPGSGIEKLEDLKGKRLATPQFGNTQDISAKHYLLKKLGQKDTSNVIAIANAEQAAMMERGQIDAAWTPEPWGARLIAEVGAKLIAEEKDLWPEGRFTLALIVTTPEFLANHPDTVRSILSVHKRWTKRLTDDRAAVLPALGDALFALTTKRLPPGVLETAIARTQFTNEPLESSLQTIATWSHELGFSAASVSLDGLVDTSLLKALD